MTASDGTAAGAALRALLERFVALHQDRHGHLPRVEHDPRWPSRCEAGEPDANAMIEWRPVERSPPADFSGIERALETELHPAIKAYYGSFWCHHIEARAEEGGLTLIQVWNRADFDRLGENLLGHALDKHRRKMALTVFFALTDRDELVLSVENATGRVVLEQPGRNPTRVVAESLGVFLERLEPLVEAP